jgi:hypothetical protein
MNKNELQNEFLRVGLALAKKPALFLGWWFTSGKATDSLGRALRWDWTKEMRCLGRQVLIGVKVSIISLTADKFARKLRVEAHSFGFNAYDSSLGRW